MALNNGPLNAHGGTRTTANYGKRLLPQVVDTFAAEDPDYVYGMMPEYTTDSSAPVEFSSLSISQLANAASFMSHWFDNTLRGINSTPGETIAYVGRQDYRYLAIECASIKTGHPLLIPSPRNAPANTVSLLERTNCTVIFHSGPFGEQKEAILKLQGDLKFFEVPTLEEMISGKADHYPYTKSWEEAKNDVVLILHTSGSTGNPKPIHISHLVMQRFDLERDIPEVEGRTLAAITLCRPGTRCLYGTNFYHMSGIGFSVSALFLRSTVIFPPADRLPNGQIMSDIIKSVEVNGVMLTPNLCDWVFAEHGDSMMEHLKNLEHVVWVGGPLGHSTGEWIIKNLPNIHLWQVFGSTETFMTPMLIPPKSHWSYMEFHPNVGPHHELIDAEQGLYEVVWKRNSDPDFAWTAPVFDIFPTLKEWRTRDLMTRCTDPGFENCWKFESRLDDLLVLNSGLKANPVHIETRLQSHPALKGCLVFGEGYNTCGLLLEPKSADIPPETLIELVWPAVVETNSLVPEHVRIDRNMIIVGSPNKPLARAGKGTVIRKVTVKLYQKEIEGIYTKD